MNSRELLDRVIRRAKLTKTADPSAVAERVFLVAELFELAEELRQEIAWPVEVPRAVDDALEAADTSTMVIALRKAADDWQADMDGAAPR